jgi:hypothetical protein
MSRKALGMEHLSPFRGSVRGTWRDSSYTEGYDRHVMEGSGNGALLLYGNPRYIGTEGSANMLVGLEPVPDILFCHV